MFIRAGFAGLCILILTPAFASAQAATYLVTGATFEVPKRDSTTSTGTERVLIGGVNLGVGFPLGRASLEFAGFWHSAETDVDRDGRTAISEYRVRNRDFPFVAGIRFQPFCPDSWCAEVNGGFGINFSRRSVTKIGDCGPAGPISPCVAAPGATIDTNKEEFTGFFGTSVTLVVADRIEIGPTLKLWYVRRYRDRLNPINVARTPSNERLEIGVTAIWHFRR